MRKIRNVPAQLKKDQGRILAEMSGKIKKIAKDMEHTTIADYIQLLNSPRKLIVTNFIAGLSRGVGLAIGFTIIASVIVYLLNALVTLNIPIIGNFITYIVKEVQSQLNIR
jgi:hypothetical protein